MVISTSHQGAGALHKPPRAVSKCCWQIKVIKKSQSLVYSPLHHTFTPSPTHQCEIMVFAFICQRSIFQTSDKRGNWTGNRPKCCKSTKHNYQNALKLPNRIHILKMLKWMSPSNNENWSCSPPPPSSFDHGAVPFCSCCGQCVSTQSLRPPRPSPCVNGLPLSVNSSL